MSTILVVDDEPAIRQLIARVLQRDGHTTILCSGASEAMAVPGPVDLLLVDLVLPDVNGRQLTEDLRKRWPTLPVILMSGMLPTQDMTPAQPAMFMQKPMLPKTISEAVTKLLSS